MAADKDIPKVTKAEPEPKKSKLGKDPDTGEWINVETGKPLESDPATGLTIHPDTGKPMYPEAATAPGDEHQLQKLHSSLGAITDVGSLAQVLHAIVSRCKTHHVHPDVIKQAFTNAGVK